MRWLGWEGGGAYARKLILGRPLSDVLHECACKCGSKSAGQCLSRLAHQVFFLSIVGGLATYTKMRFCALNLVWLIIAQNLAQLVTVDESMKNAVFKSVPVVNELGKVAQN